MKRILLSLLLAVIVIAIGRFLYGTLGKSHWSGGFTQIVNVDSDRLRPRKIFYFTMDERNKGYVNELLMTNPEHGYPFRLAEDFDGKAFSVEVASGGVVDFNGNEIAYFREKWLGIVIYLDEGKHARKLEAIPERGHDRPIRVIIP